MTNKTNKTASVSLDDIKRAKASAKAEGISLKGITKTGKDGAKQIVWRAEYAGRIKTHANPLYAVSKMLEKMEAEGLEAVVKLVKAVVKPIKAVVKPIKAEAEDEDEAEAEAKSSTVVPDKYRQLYRQKSGASNCGDWLALTLTEVFEGDNGFDWRAYLVCMAENGLDVENGKWAQSRSRGFQGRLRMSGRIKLEIALLKSGKLFLPGLTVDVPADFAAHLAEKHHRHV